jgi:hypothetical protein
VGIPFGPFYVPSDKYGPEFTGTYRPRLSSLTLLTDLEAARRANLQVILNFTGNAAALRDENGFSFAKWKQRVDEFRGIDFTSYITDGTVVGHFIMDEPSDAHDWSGKPVSHSQIDEMARYSKEIWPSMATIIRGWPDYLKGYQFSYLDAAWAQYHVRFGSIRDFIDSNIRDAQAAGLALVGGLNVLNGGSGESGIPGRKEGKYAMSASEIRSWGGDFLSEPYICAFLMWEYDSQYFSRPDIQAAVAELKQQAESHPKKPCRP